MFGTMNGLIRKRIEDSGLQKKFIANQLKVAASALSMYLKGDRGLPGDKEQKLKIILEHQEKSNAQLSSKVI